MPKLYIISPEQTNTINKNSEYYLNLIIKEITSCLNSNSINYEIISQNNNINLNNNQENIVFEFKINNNPDNNSQGILIYFPEENPDYYRLANYMFENINKISNSKILSYSNFDTPKIIVNLGNINSEQDLSNIRENIENIAQEIIMSLDQYFGLPYVSCTKTRTGISKTDQNIHKKPDFNSEIIDNIIPGEKINIIGQWEDWYIVQKNNNNLGYIHTKYIKEI